ncbi:MAG: amidohydrolase family protein [Planctomycetota bacterium]
MTIPQLAAPRAATPRAAAVASLSIIACLALAQPTADSGLTPPANGPVDVAPTRHLLTGATVHVAPGRTLEDAGVLFDSGRIVAAEPGLAADAGAQVHDTSGLHVYAAFIEPWAEVEMPKVDPASPGAHWSERMTPQRDVLTGPGMDESDAERLRKLGFGAALIVPEGGILAGRGAVVSIAEPFGHASSGRPPVYAGDTVLATDFERAGWGSRSHPTSHMGVVSMMRQALLDAPEHAEGALAYLDTDARPIWWHVADESEALLADNILSEFGIDNAVLVGSGTEFRRLDSIVAADRPIVVPLRFPAKPDVATVGHADAVSLEAMMAWEQAPTNPRRLLDAGLTIALTSSDLPRGAKFHDNLRRAVADGGLEPGDALAMLTTTPAELLGVADDLGTIEPGKVASLAVFDRPFTEDGAKLLDVWIDGRRHTISRPDENETLAGSWSLVVGPENAPFFTMPFRVEGKKVIIEHEGEDHDARSVSLSAPSISFLVDDLDNSEGGGSYIMTGTLQTDATRTGDRILGTGIAPDGAPFQWAATRDSAADPSRFNGTWNALLSGQFELDFKVAKGPEVTVIERVANADDIEQTAESASMNADGSLTFTFDHAPFGDPGIFTVTLDAPTNTALAGRGNTSSGSAFTLTASKAPKARDDAAIPADLGGFPFGPYAVTETPPASPMLITGATLWTSGPDGVVEDGFIFVNNGKVVFVGRAAPDGSVSYAVPEGTQRIDATGMHITPGLIDAHSHTGLFRLGVNEAGQAVTAECRILDSLDPTFINWYRQLAGGVTTAMLLHGSANPIGGQSQTVKVRWGATNPADFVFEGAKPGIKFALGENVKQSNWGSEFNSRYPQTRMGVETIMRDRFHAAQRYLDNGRKTDAGRTDLELEALAEILAGERLIHCHSYRQDEILMLCRIAEDFGFKIGTFQHGLETYKVAETVKQHAYGASIFSDWWAFKVEVQDAIPYAGPINHEAGLLTSFNSDSDELARRMNLEAAKALKYARESGIAMTPQEALNFVTINPAIQLGIDERVGSIEPGKDADLVLWNASPLSTMSRPEHVFIEGIERFSTAQDAAHRERIRAERERLIQKILGAPDRAEDTADEADPSAGDPGIDGDEPERDRSHGLMARHFASEIRRHAEISGMPGAMLPGDCGCMILHAFDAELDR